MTSASPPTLAKLGSKLDESVVFTKNGPIVRRVDQFTNSEWLLSTYITGVVCQACLPWLKGVVHAGVRQIVTLLAY